MTYWDNTYYNNVIYKFLDIHQTAINVSRLLMCTGIQLHLKIYIVGVSFRN